MGQNKNKTKLAKKQNLPTSNALELLSHDMLAFNSTDVDAKYLYNSNNYGLKDTPPSEEVKSIND